MYTGVFRGNFSGGRGVGGKKSNNYVFEDDIVPHSPWEKGCQI